MKAPRQPERPAPTGGESAQASDDRAAAVTFVDIDENSAGQRLDNLLLRHLLLPGWRPALPRRGWSAPGSAPWAAI